MDDDLVVGDAEVVEVYRSALVLGFLLEEEGTAEESQSLPVLVELLAFEDEADDVVEFGVDIDLDPFVLLHAILQLLCEHVLVQSFQVEASQSDLESLEVVEPADTLLDDVRFAVKAGDKVFVDLLGEVFPGLEDLNEIPECGKVLFLWDLGEFDELGKVFIGETGHLEADLDQ